MSLRFCSSSHLLRQFSTSSPRVLSSSSYSSYSSSSNNLYNLQSPSRPRNYSFITNILTSLTSTDESVNDGEIDPGTVEGTTLTILKYPHPSLRAANAPVTDFEISSGSIKQTAKEMFLVMYAANGVGLAAPQVGVNKRLMVFNQDGDEKKWMSQVVLINPTIVEKSVGKAVDEEGCLSFPNMAGDVSRHKWIKVEGVNGLTGKKWKKKFVGFEARIFQHEYDHLDGVCYIDHLSEEGRGEVQEVLDELVASRKGEGGEVEVAL
ncbi:hypothetical protein ScalyP_jg10413 [Parmales sp. scaly parma]|nr:hypothetical protein ScalyP_jg10413 [Parmales sp. scaly parma]